MLPDTKADWVANRNEDACGFRHSREDRLAGKTLVMLDTATAVDAEKLYVRLGWTRLGVIPRYTIYPDGRWVAHRFSGNRSCRTCAFSSREDGPQSDAGVHGILFQHVQEGWSPGRLVLASPLQVRDGPSSSAVGPGLDRAPPTTELRVWCGQVARNKISQRARWRSRSVCAPGIERVKPRPPPPW
jgi:hypothetical protein